MAKKSGGKAEPGRKAARPEDDRPASVSVPFKIPKKSYRKLESLRRWEERSSKSDMVLTGRP